MGNSTCCWQRWRVGALAGIVFLVGCGASSARAADAAAYVAGIESLAAGNFKQAIAEFTQALATNEENADALRARGVAQTLAENFPAAIADLKHALRLQANDHEAKLWLAAAYCMSGDPATGSSYFTFTGLPHEYAELVYNIVALDYWSSRDHGTYYDREQRQQVAVTAPVKKQFPEAARLYAERHKAAGAEASALVAQRVQAALQRGDWAAALPDLRILRRAAPDDAALRGQWASCLLGIGDAYHAREEFTHTLCIEPLWREGYVGRAQAAAFLGDPRCANADLETAAALGATPSAKRVMVANDDAVAQFAAALEADTTDDALADKALAVHRWFNARRLRYDEEYQDRIWALSDAARLDRKNTAWPEGLARFLYNYHLVPTAWNGPRATEQFRPQSKAEHAQELQRSLDTADVALRLDPRNVNAIATKALVYFTLGNTLQAERFADEGLAIDRRNLRLLHLKVRILFDRAASLDAQASALRAGHTESYTENRSDGVYRVTRHTPATPAELAQAAACEAEAAACRRQAEQVAAEAAKVKSVVIPSLLKARAFDEAARCDPDRVDVLKGQAELARRRGDARGAKAYTLLATPLEHTTAAPKLQTAWNEVVRTAWKSAGETLNTAAQIDPSDARVPAYRAIIAAGRGGDVVTAARQRRAALALEEAHVRLMGTSFLTANAVPVSVRDVALTMALRLEHSRADLAAGRAELALTACQFNAGLESRFEKFQLVEMAPTALLPDPTADPEKIPDSPSLASLLAWSHLGAGRALVALNRPAEALDQYRTVRAYRAHWPATAPGRETLIVVCAWAQLGLAEAMLATKDYDQAMKMVLDEDLHAWGLPRELVQRVKAMQQEISDARMRQFEDQRAADARMTPRQLKLRYLRQEIASMKQQRDGIQAEADKPGASERERAVYRGSVQELDRAIAQREAAAAQLEQASDDPATPPPQGSRPRTPSRRPPYSPPNQ